MPDLDSGHYFLTTLAPIKDSATAANMHGSYTQAVRIALAKLPSAIQSPATEKIGQNSPFARNTRTHLARMFVLNDVVFNGRVGRNALAASLLGDDPADVKPVDRLNTSYLVFCADIDAVLEDGAPLPKELSPSQQRRVREAYAIRLWETMEAELREIYMNCEGFDGVDSAQDFADYLNRCHVETTMPFHDYYLELPKFHHLPLKWLIAAVALPLLFSLFALVLRLSGVMQVPGVGIDTLLGFVLGLVVTGAAAYAAVSYALRNGEKPLPPAKYDDLPSVLKALYLQQKFADFVVEAQGASPQDLHKQFGAFVETHKPADRRAPTQSPGVIAAP
ncbi:MAG: hypothetical protein PVI41_10595 [Roseobacter sp.]|jgi:hypothetical protein